MVYDGQCGFCKYWIIKWKKISGNQINYQAYQRVHEQFKDIEVSHFREAVRLIDTNGEIYNGPDAAFRTFYLKGRFGFLHRWYSKSQIVRKAFNRIYQWIADHRNFLFKVSKHLFGASARKPSHKWLNYLIGFLAISLTLICVYIANSAKL